MVPPEPFLFAVEGLSGSGNCSSPAALLWAEMRIRGLRSDVNKALPRETPVPSQ
ncbi:hypothetical protein SCAR479_10683 [Seiridium cardinale]|uniref:Uncharacterized protein n=1 Tax=Seiridium cardinale TaxID=138064 RepID=A0ABR2XFT6_9PEZI